MPPVSGRIDENVEGLAEFTATLAAAGRSRCWRGAYQDAGWRRTKLVQELRARLREYYPGFLADFLPTSSESGRALWTTKLASTDARAVLAIAPSPAEVHADQTQG